MGVNRGKQKVKNRVLLYKQKENPVNK